MTNRIQNSNIQCPSFAKAMAGKQTTNGEERKYDLAERTAIFGENVIKFMKEIKETTITRPLISQLIRSATSIGANYMEADCAESRKDFVHKIGIVRKESKETVYWLRMLAITVPEYQEKCEQLSGEAIEFTRIFSAIARTGKLNLSKNI